MGIKLDTTQFVLSREDIEKSVRTLAAKNTKDVDRYIDLSTMFVWNNTLQYNEKRFGLFKRQLEKNISSNKLPMSDMRVGCIMHLYQKPSLHHGFPGEAHQSMKMGLSLKAKQQQGLSSRILEIDVMTFPQSFKDNVVPGEVCKLHTIHPWLKFLKDGEKVLGYKLQLFEGDSAPQHPTYSVWWHHYDEVDPNRIIIPLKPCEDNTNGIVFLNESGEQEIFPKQEDTNI